MLIANPRTKCRAQKGQRFERHIQDTSQYCKCNAFKVLPTRSPRQPDQDSHSVTSSPTPRPPCNYLQVVMPEKPKGLFRADCCVRPKPRARNSDYLRWRKFSTGCRWRDGYHHYICIPLSIPSIGLTLPAGVFRLTVVVTPAIASSCSC